jgi:hypothetical protein
MTQIQEEDVVKHSKALLTEEEPQVKKDSRVTIE